MLSKQKTASTFLHLLEQQQQEQQQQQQLQQQQQQREKKNKTRKTTTTTTTAATTTTTTTQSNGQLKINYLKQSQNLIELLEISANRTFYELNSSLSVGL